MFENIPVELKVYDQWILWRYETSSKGKSVKIPYSAVTGRRADVMNSHDWCSFDAAMQKGNMGGFDGLGFVLTKNDPFVFIDLDAPKEDISDEDRQYIANEQNAIFNAMQSYSEKSPSGKGLHIIVKGSIPRARKTRIVELYDCDRYMTMTGNIFINSTIENRENLVNELFLYVGGKEADMNEVQAGNSPEIYPDEEVLRICANAANGQKFLELFNGDWQQYYSSQSEADLALIDIVAFYTQNKEQIRRIFLSSKLADRDKAQRSAYFEYNVKKALDRALPVPDVDALLREYEKTKSENVETVSPQLPKLEEPKPQDYTLPPGLMGEIANFVYNAAPRPVAEMALVAAIGLMAGIAGRAYNISRTGLNQYILLLAPTGTGKEGVAYGINALMSAVAKDLPIADGFIGPDKIGSEQALSRHMAKGNNSFVSVIGEFGIQMAQMAATNAPPHLMGVKRALLDLYNKSGNGQIARGSIYSDAEKNVNACLSPAFSIIGESVPERFYNAIDEGVVSDGLLPRFSILEYQGKRPPLREGFETVKPSFQLVTALRNLLTNAKTLNTQNKVIDVALDKDATQIFKDFDRFCDAKINGTDTDVTRQLWNRAHLKALKLAALISVGINMYNPCVTRDAALWAIDLVSKDVTNILSKFNSGAIGGNNEESLQLAALGKFADEYIKRPYHDFIKYGASCEAMHKDRVIPWAVIQRKLHRSSVFRMGKITGSEALKRTVRTMVDRCDLVRVSPNDGFMKYNTRQECYFIANPNIGDID